MVDLLSTTFPPLEELIDESLTALSHGAALTSILGIIGLVWTVSQLYGALDVAFARIYSTDPERDIVSRTARGLLVVGILVVGIVGFIVDLDASASALDALHPRRCPDRRVAGRLARLDPVPDRAVDRGGPRGLSRAAAAGAELAGGRSSRPSSSG